MNLTTVARDLSLLELPPELDEGLNSGRCTPPRTLHVLRKLHDQQPEQVHGLLASGAGITRSAVLTLRAAPEDGEASEAAPSPSNKLGGASEWMPSRLPRRLASRGGPIA